MPPFWHGASAHSSMFCSQYVPFQPVKSNCYLIWIRMENRTWCADTTSIEQSVQTLCPVETWRRISATKFIFPVQINFFMKWHFKQVSIKQVFLSENMYAWTVNLRPFWYSFCKFMLCWKGRVLQIVKFILKKFNILKRKWARGEARNFNSILFQPFIYKISLISIKI